MYWIYAIWLAEILGLNCHLTKEFRSCTPQCIPSTAQTFFEFWYSQPSRPPYTIKCSAQSNTVEVCFFCLPKGMALLSRGHAVSLLGFSGCCLRTPKTSLRKQPIEGSYPGDREATWQQCNRYLSRQTQWATLGGAASLTIPRSLFTPAGAMIVLLLATCPLEKRFLRRVLCFLLTIDIER